MERHHHYIIHKPEGFLSQFVNNEKKQKNKRLLGELYNFPKNTMAIGRLDKNSEGLLLLTTDGKVSEQVRSKKIEKEYYVQLDGLITDEAIKRLKQGVEIGFDGKRYTTLPCKVSRLNDIPVLTPPKKIRSDRHGPTSWVSICITEGKFRQVRKMTAAVGFPTLRLIRVRIGHIHLNNLASGGVIKTDDLLRLCEGSK
ncbi:pseudouridine synthase [Labilibacter marinus]|uniref:pseudouridine synthase n=1 Tax=Labilibacter marinus TaxID=1477105 RepID=UPI000830C47F|nr:pseudouridine synthase [Labilibacter marinus]